MTTVDLERIARGVVPPVGATGWRLTTLGRASDGATIYAVVPIIGGRLDGSPVFRGAQRDCTRLYDILEGRSTSRRAPDSPAAVGPRLSQPDQELTEAPDERDAGAPSGAASAPTRHDAGASPRLCAGCDEPNRPRPRARISASRTRSSGPRRR